MWDELVGALAMLAAFKLLPFDEHPLRPWEKIGSAAYVRYENTTDTKIVLAALVALVRLAYYVALHFVALHFIVKYW